MSEDRSIREQLVALADDTPRRANAVDAIMAEVARRRRRRAWTAVGAATGMVAAVGLAAAIAAGGIQTNTTPSADDGASATPSATESATASTSPTPTPTATSTASPISVARLKRHGILLSPPDQEPAITYQEAVRLAHRNFSANQGVDPLVQLFRVTVTDLGRPDPTQPYGLDLAIEDRLAWMFTYPPRWTQGFHDSSGVDYGDSYGQDIVLMDAQTGRFLMSEGDF